MQAELQELCALALLVLGWEVVFLLTVRDGDDIGRLVDTALELALVASWDWVWVDGVDWVDVLAVRAVDGVEERVQETTTTFNTGCVEDVVGLEENAVLWVDEWVCSWC